MVFLQTFSKRTFPALAALALACALIFSTLSFAPAAHADFLSCAIEGDKDVIECLGEDESEATSFTQFTGGLTAPGVEGYDPSLTQADSARDFIINVTNFVLGFLGLIAIIIVIYGGFLYLTAAGQEEQATKGKKSITYAVIGILLILGSYAIVNTVLLAPSPTGEDGLSGAAPTTGPAGSSEDQQAARRALFNFAASEVKTVARDFASAYINYTEINNDLIELSNVPSVDDASQLHSVIAGKKRVIENIQQKAGAFSQVSEVAQRVENVLDKYLQLSQEALSDAADDETAWGTFWDDGSDEFQSELNKETGEGGLGGANDQDFARAIVEAKNKIAELQVRVADNVDLPEINQAFQNVIDEFDRYASGPATASTNRLFVSLIKIAHAQSGYTLLGAPGNADVLRIITLLSELRDAVKDILFVYAVITTDVSEGNAPLIVQFDGLKSLDPNNQTLTEYKWEFGDSGEQSTNCGFNEFSGPAVTHCFQEPGTYVVKLTITSPTSEEVADGIAITRITVNPPVNKISMTAQVGQQEPIALRSYDADTGNLLLDRNVLKVTPSEAATEPGIVFDASTTDDSRVQSVRWDFGDNSEEKFGTTTDLSQEKTYSEPGTYQVVMEITDVLGNKDRKVVNVVVGDPIARMNIRPGNKLFVNQSFELDASSSASDRGQIVDYKWTPITGTFESEGPGDLELLKAAYSEPGYKEIELEVTDSLDQVDKEKINFVVESKAPVSEFKYEIPDSSQPAVVEFDGSLSYDPDGEGDLEYRWEVDGQETGTKFSYIDGTKSTSEKPKIKFKEKGTYSVALTAIDPKGLGTAPQEGEILEKDVVIDNILDIAWGSQDSPSAKLEVDEDTGEAKAKIDLTLVSENGVAYEVDWGDDEIESGEMSKTASLSHNYTGAGTFVVTASVFDADDDENSASRKVYISSSDTPVAVATISVNGSQVFDTTGVVNVSRTDTITFDASESLNTDGTGRRLTYSWDFGNGQKSTQEKANQQYKEVGTYEAILKVTNSAEVSQVSPVDKVTIEVAGEPPILRSVTAVPSGSSLTTPVTVQVQAVGAEDPDGQISRYRWWYYDPNNDSDQLGIQVTTAPSASLTIGTRGLEGEEKTYKFAVELTDDENNSISSRDILDEARTATLTVTNGPNKAPVASFTVDKTSVLAGESVNFSSSSNDPDGQITEYYWDFEGDGFANNTENLGSNVSHTFEQAAPDGVRVRLKVKDNNESEATSDAVSIFVDAIAKDPEVAFTGEQQEGGKTVKFTDNSQVDAAAGASIEKWTWDFDVNKDSNGDGSKNNDMDSSEQNPTFEYDEYGIYRAKLTVEDSEGSTASVTNFINVKAPAAAPTTPQVEARLLTNPAPSLADGKVHLKGDSSNVVLEYSTSVGEITKYSIDKNIYFDTDGNGAKDDDEDHTSTKPGKWTTDFSKEWGQIRVRLTVSDKDGNEDTVDKDIIFDAPAAVPSAPAAPGAPGGSGTGSLSANVLGLPGVEIPAALVSAAGFAILLLYRKRRLKNKRNG